MGRCVSEPRFCAASQRSMQRWRTETRGGGGGGRGGTGDERGAFAFPAPSSPVQR